MPRLLAVLLLLAMADDPAPPRSRLCVDGVCSEVSGLTFTVAPADRARPFVLTSGDASTVTLGTIDAKATSITLDPEATSPLALALAGDERRWPVGVTMIVTGKQTWKWTLDAEAARRLRTLLVPRGVYRIELEAAHHQSWQRTQIAASGEAVRLGTLRLLPLPMANGVVVDGEQRPIAGAVVTLPDATVCAISDERGVFECELPEKAPSALVVTKDGFGPREAALPLHPTRIVLGTARTLRVRVTRPEAGPARVTLVHGTSSRARHSKATEIAERVEDLHFDVSAGKYFMLVEGDGPLERLETAIEVRDGSDAIEEIEIVPYRLVGSVRFGEEPLHGALTVTSANNVWSEPLPLTAGAFDTTAWQRGTLNGVVTGDTLTSGEPVKSPELGADPSRWDIEIARRIISGRVTESETGKAVAGQELRVVAFIDKRARESRVQTGADGAYRIVASTAGEYRLVLESAAYVRYEKEIAIKPDDGSRTVDIVLQRAVVQKLEFFSSIGARLVSPQVHEDTGPNAMTSQPADALGRFQLRGRAGEQRVLYVAPREGSFSIVRVEMPRSNEGATPLQIHVPPPVATLRVRSVKPLLVRYNGDFVPDVMLSRIAAAGLVRRNGETILSRMPAGLYEFWELTHVQEEEPIMASGGTLRPPVRVTAGAAEVVVELRP